MSSESLVEGVKLKQTLLIQRYLTYIHSKIDYIESKVANLFLDQFNNLWRIKLDKCQELNDTTDDATRITLIWSIMNDILNNTVDKRIEDGFKLTYDAFTDTKNPLYILRDVVNRGPLEVGLVKTVRRVSFDIPYLSYDISISYILDLSMDNTDDMESTEIWKPEFDGIMRDDYLKFDMKIKPIDKFGITIRQSKDKKNIDTKQSIVVKNTPILNKLVITKIR